MEAQKQEQKQFFELAERFRNATDPEEAKRLGDQLGRMVLGADARDRDLEQSAGRSEPTSDC
jgi:hypothetical protein